MRVSVKRLAKIKANDTIVLHPSPNLVILSEFCRREKNSLILLQSGAEYTPITESL